MRHANRPTGSSESEFARLCAYYLACLARDADGGVTVAAADTANYAELSAMPLVSGDARTKTTEEQGRHLLERIARDSSAVPQLGYPVLLRRARNRKGDVPCLEPILLWSLARDGEIADEIPIINITALKALPGVGSGHPLDEVIQLSHGLGLAGEPSELPAFDELILRLHRLRPHWPWQGPPDPYRLSNGPGFVAVEPIGIYNRCVVVPGARSVYARGLEIELDRLAQVGAEQLDGTALGAWLYATFPPDVEPSTEPLLEVLPLNEEQRQAIRKTLVNPLTVVTGPPGTGKSQLIAALLANAAWHGQKVLLASRNNKAVDVVEERVNRLGSRPLLLRLGRDDKRQRLQEHLRSLLSATVDDEDKTDYQRCLETHERLRATDAALQSEAEATITLRNEVDRLEQACEGAREHIGDLGFASVSEARLKVWRERIDTFAGAALKARPVGQSFWLRLLWPVLRRRRRERLRASRARVAHAAEQLGLPLDPRVQAAPIDDAWAARCLEEAHELIDRLADAEAAVRYRQCLSDLQRARTPTAIAGERRRLLDRLVSNSTRLWDAWLRVMPSTIPQPARQRLTEFVNLLGMLQAAGRDNARRRLFSKYYSLFPQVARYLPAWAVTALSARGRLPLQPGLFDLVVIDEASQCDIASAIPLLYRAKRAVIIGDPKQLPHITRLAPAQDQILLTRHGLLDSRLSWSYRANSLYNLAASLVGPNQVIMLRDHFRSHPAIIGFSNAMFYEGRLRMATRLDELKRPSRDGRSVPGMSWQHISGRVVRPPEGGAVNQAEAQAVVRELRRLVLESGYTGSVGVVTPFRAHANRIRQLVECDDALWRRLSALGFLVDTADGFQGDERDVVVFSPVVSDRTPPGALWFLCNEPNRFNVAITRARAALIVVGDQSAAERSGVDLLAKFALCVKVMSKWSPLGRPNLEHPGPIYPPVRDPERVSEWERTLYRSLCDAGLRPVPQYDFAGMILDFALFDGERRLAIEVDGEMYHRAWDGDYCRRDQARNWRLMEAGWDVERVWVYELRDDLDGVVNRIRNWQAREASRIPSEHAVALS